MGRATPFERHSPMNKKVTALGLTAGLLAGAGAGFLLESSGSAGAAGNVAVVGAAAGATAATDTTVPSDSTGAARPTTPPAPPTVRPACRKSSSRWSTTARSPRIRPTR